MFGLIPTPEDFEVTETASPASELKEEVARKILSNDN